MDKIRQRKFKITDAEKETALCLLRDMTVKEITAVRYLSVAGVQDQTKRIRIKMETSTIYGALGRMIATGIITEEELRSCLPENWGNHF